MDNVATNQFDDVPAQYYHEIQLKALHPIADYTAAHYFGNLEGKTVVDFGCGTGRFLKSHLNRGASFCLGLDISESMINCGGNEVMDESAYMLKRKSNSSGQQLCFLIHDCFQPFKQNYGQFDFAQALFILYNCKDETELQNFLKNAYGCLKNNGKLFIGQTPTVKTLKDQDTIADLFGLVQPLKEVMGDNDPYFSPSDLAVKPAPPSVSKTGRPFTRDRFFDVSNRFWSKEKVMENMVKVGFTEVKLLPPVFPDEVSPLEREQINSLEEPMLLIGAIKP